MELISPSPSSSCSTPTTPFFTAPSSPSSSTHPSYHTYDDGSSSYWHHRFSLAFDHCGGQPDCTLLPYYDHEVDDDETGDFEFELNGFPGKVSSASANDLFLEGKIRSLSGVGSNRVIDSPGDYERDDCDRIECYSCPTPRLRVCDILVQGDEEDAEEEEDGGDGDSSFEPSARDHMAATKAVAASTSCAVGYLSSLLPGASLLRYRRSRNKSWSFKDFLFRSTSEGRGTSKAAELAKGRSPPETCGRGRRGGAASTHELHYCANKMVSEEMRRRTALPYKHGFFACLGHGGNHQVARGSRSGSVCFTVGSNRR